MKKLQFNPYISEVGRGWGGVGLKSVNPSPSRFVVRV